MVSFLLVLPPLISFLTTLFLIPYWIKKAHQIGLIWPDFNKYSSEKQVAGSGGIMVICGFILGVLIFIGFRVFILQDNQSYIVEIFAALSSILILGCVGLIDDLLGWRRGGLSKVSRIFIVGFAAIPLMVINAGRSDLGIPFLQTINIGILYPLVVIPIGIIGATTTYNFLAGFNGLEAGQGVLILSALSIVAHLVGASWVSVILLCMVFALLAFLLFNICPAKIFPGDTLTYAVGGLIAIASILGNFEKIAIFFFIPYIIEFCLKSRKKYRAHSFGKPASDESLDLLYPKLYSLTHVAIYLLKKANIRPTERKVVLVIWGFQLIIIIIGFLLYFGGVFNA